VLWVNAAFRANPYLPVQVLLRISRPIMPSMFVSAILLCLNWARLVNTTDDEEITNRK
jgi:hypothetical protein